MFLLVVVTKVKTGYYTSLSTTVLPAIENYKVHFPVERRFTGTFRVIILPGVNNKRRKEMSQKTYDPDVREGTLDR